MSHVAVNEHGKIIVADEAIATIAGAAALESYGLVGMCSRSRLKDNFVELLGKENLSRGIEITLNNNKVVIDLYIIVSWGTKISEVAQNVMETVKYAVENQVGLHARPATFFIQKANEFKSSIWIEKEERRVNAKSLLGILSLGIVGGTAIRIIADGSDEQSAVDALVGLVESGFSEDSR